MGIFGSSEDEISKLRNSISELEKKVSSLQSRLWKLEDPPKFKNFEKVYFTEHNFTAPNYTKPIKKKAIVLKSEHAFTHSNGTRWYYEISIEGEHGTISVPKEYLSLRSKT